MELLKSIPESVFEILGLAIGFFVCFITAVQMFKEFKSNQASSLSLSYVFGWVFVYFFWTFYGLRLETIALSITNGLALFLQIGLCLVVFER